MNDYNAFQTDDSIQFDYAIESNNTFDFGSTRKDSEDDGDDDVKINIDNQKKPDKMKI